LPTSPADRLAAALDVESPERRRSTAAPTFDRRNDDDDDDELRYQSGRFSR